MAHTRVTPPGTKRITSKENIALFAAALLVAIGGLIYELILGTAASYLVGDSILSFSLATGITLFGMGVGSLLVRHIRWHPATSFAVNEILLGLVGGNSVLLLYSAFSLSKLHWPVFALISLVIGVLIGLEIPLLVKMFTRYGRPSSVELLSKVLAIDYFGALVASLVFPLFLLPSLGLMRSTYLIATLNIAVAVLILLQLKTSRRLLAASVVATVLLLGLFFGASWLEHRIDTKAYKDPVILYQQSAYQKIVLTKYKQDLRLYLSNNLQFSSLDEARYHETLAGAAMTAVKQPKNVLIMGGGDGLLAREILRYPSVEHITLVDIDPAMTQLARTNPLLAEQNQRSLASPKVRVVNEDAFLFAFKTHQVYDAILIDLVDPSNDRLAKLYSQQFYRQAARILSPSGVMITQATSSYFSPHAFAMVASTVASAQPQRHITPFSINVPSFGEWGFVLSTKDTASLLSQPLPPGLSYTDSKLLDYALRQRPASLPPAGISTLLTPRIIDVYNRDMAQWRYQ